MVVRFEIEQRRALITEEYATSQKWLCMYSSQYRLEGRHMVSFCARLPRQSPVST